MNMKDPLDIARSAAQDAIAEGTRKDQRDRPSEVTWLQRAQAFAFISIAESLREIIDWASIGDDLKIATNGEPGGWVDMATGLISGVLVTDDMLCNREEPGPDPYKCARMKGHSMPHRTLGGHEWETPAEPLVMCGEPDGDSERCVLLPGHEGGHMAYFATGPSWRDEAEPLHVPPHIAEPSAQ